MNIASFLVHAARQYGERPAISAGDALHATYAELGQRVARLAGGLATLGAPGDRVALAMSNCPEYLEVLFAVWHAGLCAVPMNARLHGRELAYMIEHCGAKLCFATADVAEELSRHARDAGGRLIVIGDAELDDLTKAEPIALQRAAPMDPAWIFYTSGTTGRPKGATLSHRNLMAMAIAYLADVDFLTADDCLIHLAAQSHASGLFALSHIPKGSHQIVPASGGFDVSELASLIGHYRNISFFVPPTLLRRLNDADQMARAPVDRIRTILCGAAPVHAGDLKAALARFGPRIWNGYGQGESPCTITAMSKEMVAEAAARGDDARLISVGVARTGVEVAVRDEAGAMLPDGEVGEVTVSGDVIMQGYWHDEAASAAALGPMGLCTGDLGVLDASGYLTLKDRAKDMIISGGINVYPCEVEEVLLSHPEVAEAAVVGAPDREWGERVVAFVVRKGGAPVDETALDALCLARIARFKRPRRYVWLDDLPKNAYGKVLKRDLRTRAAGDAEREKQPGVRAPKP